MVYLKGGGLSGSLNLEGEAGQDAKWKVEVSHAKSITDRQADGGVGYTISTTAEGVDWCTGTSCSVGAASPLSQRQWDSLVKAQWDQPLFGGDMRFGAEYARIMAIKRRDEEGQSLRHISISGKTSTRSAPTPFAVSRSALSLAVSMVFMPWLIRQSPITSAKIMLRR